MCLDAPLVAVAWQALFARVFGAPLTGSLRALLFLTAWLIYLGDRFIDTVRLPAGAPLSARQKFCQQHAVAWWLAVVMIFLADLALALRSLDLQMFLLGATLASICCAYLVSNHLLGGKWWAFPVKEKAIGVLFAAGTALAVVAELPGLTIAFAVALILFAFVCILNCLCIAAWERELDLAQGKNSLLVSCPAFARALSPIGLGICAASAILLFVWPFAISLWLCLAASALLLARLRGAKTLALETRTALADLVLLTPVLALAWLRR